MALSIVDQVKAWVKSERPVRAVVYGLIDAAAALLKSKASRIPFSRRQGTKL